METGETQGAAAASETEVLEMFQQGVEIGRQWAQQAQRGLATWAEKNPEQVVLAGLAAGFVLGKLFFGSRRRSIE